MSGLALTGAGADAVARGLILAMLTERPAGPIGVVITRCDAWHLLGLDTGDLVEERIPGLVLTDDLPQARTHLQTPGPRRLFISRSGGLDLLHDLLTAERGRIAAVSLSPWLHDTIDVTADGQVGNVSGPGLAGAPMTLPPALTRSEAYVRLFGLPAARRSAVLEARRRSSARP